MRHLSVISRHLISTGFCSLTVCQQEPRDLEHHTNWASNNIDARMFVSGISLFFGGNLITWRSWLQNVVGRSSIEA